VGDDEHRAVGRTQRVDAVGDDLQRIDVEAGIGLVEHAQLGSSSFICRISARFFSPPEKPDIERALEHVLADVRAFRPLLAPGA
jgi:hypothetical protein